ncbi:MAG: Eco57I restriction-modification methylase domain-containing protein [Flavobacterium sp.]|nr:Eco57I restriction-modification methylase domain-containing protein [Flavobacterium sp.]
MDENKPQALPNLDYKIVVGDSLIPKFDGEILEIDWDKKTTISPKFNVFIANGKQLLAQIVTKQKAYFDPKTKYKPKAAAEIRNLKIYLLINQLAYNKLYYLDNNTKLIDSGLGLTAKEKQKNLAIDLHIAFLDNQTKKLNQLLANHDLPFDHFDWKLDFPEILNDQVADFMGFDIVIGNPPYIDSESMLKSGNEKLREYLSKKMKFCKGNWDIYIAFFDYGFTLLSQNGNLVFITPDKWISKPFGYELRKGLKNNFIKIAEAGRKVFETAKVDSIITFISANNKDKIKIDKFENYKPFNYSEVYKNTFEEPFAYDWLFSDNVALLSKFNLLQNKFSDYAICENACATSDAYKLQDYVLELGNNDFNSEKHLKVINKGTIGKYTSKWGDRQMTYLGNKYLKPIVNKQKFLLDFANSYGTKSIVPKIIIKSLTLLDGCLDIDGCVIPGKSTLVIKTKNKVKDLYFPLSILNSKFAIFFIKQKYRGSSYNQGINFNYDMINNLPLPKMNLPAQTPFINLVDKILKAKKSGNATQHWENEIDIMVYKLYDLSYAEAKIIDNDLSESDFDKYNLADNATGESNFL